MPLIRAIRRKQGAQAGVKEGSQGEASPQGPEPSSGGPERKSALRLARRKLGKPDPAPEPESGEVPVEPPDPGEGAGSGAQPLDPVPLRCRASEAAS